MNIASFSIKNKVLVNLITIAVMIIGIVVTMGFKREAFPTVEVDSVTVSTNYQGASPFEVEKLITIPIEDSLKSIDGIDTYSSISREGVSYVFIELDTNLPNKDKVINEISREVDKVELPQDVDDPTVKEIILERPLIEISFSGHDISEAELRQYAGDFEDIVKEIKGVASVDKSGWRDREVSIEIDPKNLERYYVSLEQVIESIRNHNLNLPGGKITSGTRELILRTVGELEKAEQFGDIIIRTNSDGQYLYVKDIAQIKDTFEEEEKIYKTDGKVSINITPKKKDAGDTITLVNKIREEVEEYKKVLPENVSVDMLNDSSLRVKRRLGVLISNGIMGLILVMITLLVFLNVRVALVTALGIPFAFLTALIFMSFFGVSLNMITMFGLILVLGMIVDDAIVVSENVYRYMEDGLEPVEATIKGATEVAAPVSAAVLTTVASFLPLMYISGVLGKFLRFFPMGVVACLAASLFEALFILPSHLAEWVRPLTPTKEETTKKWFNFFSQNRKGSEAPWFKAMSDSYERILTKATKRRYLVSLVAFIIFLAALLFSAKIMSFKLFPNTVDAFYVRVETVEGSSLAETNKVISEIEKIILELPKSELENVTTVVGFIGEGGRGGPMDKHGSKYAQCVAYLTPENDRGRDANQIIAAIRKKIEEEKISGFVSLKFELNRHGPPVGKPVAVEVRGDSYDTLIKLSEEISAYMAALEGAEDIRSDYELDKEEIQVSINKEEAARLGLNVRMVAETIRHAFDGGGRYNHA
ncbi:MAG: efflux RND transporter permease subunit [Nitrospinae bacterium]|nr:efflux RND transporter permease subunit [Nitrospinota bacterium]